MGKMVYSTQEVAELLGISRSYAYELVRNGTIPSLKLGKKRLVPQQRVVEWINGRKDK